MGNAGTASGQFRTALRTKSLGLALNLARELPTVDLPDAARLTVLAAQKGDPRFEPMSVRLLARLLDERRLSLEDVLYAARRLQDAREGKPGETGLLNLIRHRPGA